MALALRTPRSERSLGSLMRPSILLSESQQGLTLVRPRRVFRRDTRPVDYTEVVNAKLVSCLPINMYELTTPFFRISLVTSVWNMCPTAIKDWGVGTRENGAKPEHPPEMTLTGG